MKNIKLIAVSLVSIILIFCCSACGSSSQQKSRTQELDDGSVIVRENNGPIYYHRLFDYYTLHFGDGYFFHVLEKMDRDAPFTVTALSVKQGYYVKYSFDPDGYIAYYRILQAESATESNAYTKKIGGTERNILAEQIVLYVCNEDREIIFDSADSLYAYCEENNIHLGSVYYSKGYGSQKEELIFEHNMWSVYKTPWDYYNVKYNNKDIFMGSIDSYSITGDYLIIHLELPDNIDYLKGLNNDIQFSEDTVIKYERHGLLKKIGIYADNYIVIDTKTDKYNIFTSENEAVNSVSAETSKIEWTKI